MKRVIMTVVFSVMTGGAFATDFSDLQTLKTSDLNAVTEKFSAPISMDAVSDKAKAPAGTPYTSLLYDTKAKAEANLQRILKDAKKQGIPVQNQPIVESQTKYYFFKIVFGSKMYIDNLESYVMNETIEREYIRAIESAGGVHLWTDYDPEDGMSVCYVMPEGNQPDEVHIDQ